MKPHKHAELIKAWADGAKIQYKFKETTTWQYHSCPYWDNPQMEFRIQPESKPDIKKKFGFIHDIESNQTKHFFIPQIEVTFDGTTGEFKSAEVLK